MKLDDQKKRKIYSSTTFVFVHSENLFLQLILEDLLCQHIFLISRAAPRNLGDRAEFVIRGLKGGHRLINYAYLKYFQKTISVRNTQKLAAKANKYQNKIEKT